MYSILLVNYNRLEYLKRTLFSVFEQTEMPYELLIWDNASTELGMKEFLEDLNNEDNIKVFFSNKNIGVWQASNRLIARAHKPEINGFIKIDNDVIIKTSNWANRWIQCSKANPEIGMLGANIEGKKERSADTEVLMLNGHPLLSLINEGTGGAVYIPGHTFQRLGYYNEEYGIYGQGDKDYARRVFTLGQKFVYHRQVEFERFAVNYNDLAGGYRVHKNLYVRRNRKLYVLNRYMYQHNLRDLAIWYEKYPHPENVPLSDPTPRVNWENGRINNEVRQQIKELGLEKIKK